MKDNPVRWFEIYVDDMARAQAFYEGVFELTLSKLDSPGMDMMAFNMAADKVGAGGALVRMEAVQAGANSTIVYFGSEDCAYEEARVVSFGGRIFKPKTSLGPYGFMILAHDTEGNLIGVHSMS